MTRLRQQIKPYRYRVILNFSLTHQSHFSKITLFICTHNLGRKLWKELWSSIFYDNGGVSALFYLLDLSKLFWQIAIRGSTEPANISTIIDFTLKKWPIWNCYFLGSSINDDFTLNKFHAKTSYYFPAALTRSLLFARIWLWFKGYRIHLQISTTKRTFCSSADMRILWLNEFMKSYANVQKFLGLIDDEQLGAARMMSNQNIDIFGTGSSGLVAREMKLRLWDGPDRSASEALTDQFAWTTSIDEKRSLDFPSQEQHHHR